MLAKLKPETQVNSRQQEANHHQPQMHENIQSSADNTKIPYQPNIVGNLEDVSSDFSSQGDMNTLCLDDFEVTESFWPHPRTGT